MFPDVGKVVEISLFCVEKAINEKEKELSSSAYSFFL